MENTQRNKFDVAMELLKLHIELSIETVGLYLQKNLKSYFRNTIGWQIDCQERCNE
jgi:hypothetical protein